MFDLIVLGLQVPFQAPEPQRPEELGIEPHIVREYDQCDHAQCPSRWHKHAGLRRQSNPALDGIRTQPGLPGLHDL